MLTFTTEKTINSISRQVYTGDKSTYQSVATSKTGYLRPLNEEQSSVNGVQYGKGFALIVECDVDIQEGDKVQIESVNYTVRGVANHDRGNYTKYKRAVITLPEKQ